MDKTNYLLTFFLIIFTVSLWIYKPTMVNDSFTYAGVSKNFVDKGKLFYYTNWPHYQMDEELSEFTDFAPGLVFLTIPFQYIFQDIEISFIFLQSLLIVIYGITFYYFLKKLKLNNYMFSIGLIVLVLFPFNFKVMRQFLTETPFIISSIFFLFFSLRYFKDENNKNLIFLILFAFLSSSFKYLGVLNFISFGIIFFIEKRKEYKDLILIGLFSGLPILLWFLRNYFLIGEFSQSHNFGTFSGISLFFKYEINNIFQLEFFIFILLLISFLFIFLIPILNNKLEKYSYEYKIIMIFGFVSLIGLFGISMFSKFDSVGGRLLTYPTTYFILLGVLFFNNKFVNYQKYIAIIILIPMLFLNTILWKKDNNIIKQEKELWSSLIENDYYNHNSSHFFNQGGSYAHELFTNIPIRLLFDKDLNKNYVDSIMGLGHNPFILIENNNPNMDFFNDLFSEKKLQKFKTEFDYTLFFRKEK